MKLKLHTSVFALLSVLLFPLYVAAQGSRSLPVSKEALRKARPFQQFVASQPDAKVLSRLPVGPKPVVRSRGLHTLRPTGIPVAPKRLSPLLRAAQQQVQMIGSVVNAASWSDLDPDYGDEIPYGMYAFKTADNITTSMLSDIDNNLVFNGGVAYFDNVAHGIYYENSAWFGLSVYYLEYNMDNWECTKNQNLPGIDMVSSPGLAYDRQSGNTYGIFYDASSDGTITGRTLATIDFATLTRSDIAPVDTLFRTLSASPDGQLYGISRGGNLFRIDKHSGQLTLVGNTGVIPASYLQSSAFDQRTGKFYWAAYLAEGQSTVSRLYEVNPSTAALTLVGNFADNEEIVGLHIPAPAADDGAPARVTTLNATFQPESTHGTLIFQMPRKTFGGTTIPSGTELNYVIRANGDEVASGKGVVGKLVSCEVDVDPGMTTFTLVVSNSVGNSPEAKLTLYIGPDQPVAPSAVRLTFDASSGRDTLTWTAPTRGRHGGTLKADNLSYTIIRYPADTIARGYKQTLFTEQLATDAPLRPFLYTVVPSNGSIGGSGATSNNIVVGQASEPPYVEDFASTDAFYYYLCNDANDDGFTWRFDNGKASYSYHSLHTADDWLIMPRLRLRAGRTYTLTFHAGCGISGYAERIAVGFGQGDNPKAYSTIVEPTLLSTTDTLFKTQVTAGSDGDYHFAFHALSDADRYKLSVSNIAVDIVPVGESPDSAQTLTLTAAPKGELRTTISFKAPTKTLDGAKLTSLSKMTVTSGKRLIATITGATPGQTYTVEDTKPANGNNEYTVQAFNDYGAGRARQGTVFVGFDIPMPPVSPVLADVRTKARLTWKAPAKGASGHYINPDSLTYNIYKVSNNFLYGYVDGVRGTSVDLTDVKPDEGVQRALGFYMDANSPAGGSTPVPTTAILVGKPTQLPYHEPFSQTGIQSQYLWTESTGESNWQVASGLSINFDNACIVYSPSNVADTASICTEKIAVKGARRPTFSFAYMVIGGADMGFDVIVDKAPQDVNEKVESVDFKTLSGVGWQRMFVDLSKYASEDYVMVKIRAWNKTTGDDAYPVVVDDIRLTDRKDHDLSVILSSPVNATAGQEVKARLRVANEGTKEAAGYTVRLLAGKKEVASYTETRGALPVGGLEDYDLSFVPSMAVDRLPLEAVVDYAADENTDDNRADSVLVVKGLDAPVVNDLTASATGHDISLHWSAPAIPTEPQQTTESFESYDAFSHSDFGPWLNVNADEGEATYGFNSKSGISFPDMSKPLGYVVFNPKKAGADMNNTDIANLLRAHTGEQYLDAFSTVKRNGNSWQDINNDDWLISPELASQSPKGISFWVKAYSQNDSPETYEVLYSSTDRQTTSFKRVGEQRQAEYGSWQKDSVTLPEDAKYFAIRAVSKGKYIFMLDDITFTPAINYGASALGYKVYRDSAFVATVEAPATAYVDPGVSGGAHTYFVTVVYPKGESGRSNLASITTGIGRVVSEIEQSPTYTLTGIRLPDGAAKAKGVYIRGGKKIVVK